MIRAVLGGTFDPVHTGHLEMARFVMEQGLADVVSVVPNWRSPDKPAPTASATDRLTMVRLAFRGETGVTVDAREIEGGRPAYTIDTLSALAAERPTDRLRLVIGADRVNGFAQWRDPLRIQQVAELLVLARADWVSDAAVLAETGLDQTRVIVAAGFDQPVSSRQVRAMLASGETATGLLPAAVVAHIVDRGLYRPA